MIYQGVLHVLMEMNIYQYIYVSMLPAHTFPAGANDYQALPTVPKQNDKFCTLKNAPICPPQHILLLLARRKKKKNEKKWSWVEAPLKILLKSQDQFRPPYLECIKASVCCKWYWNSLPRCDLKTSDNLPGVIPELANNIPISQKGKLADREAGWIAGYYTVS